MFEATLKEREKTDCMPIFSRCGGPEDEPGFPRPVHKSKCSLSKPAVSSFPGVQDVEKTSRKRKPTAKNCSLLFTCASTHTPARHAYSNNNK